MGDDAAANWVKVKYSMSWPSGTDPFYLANTTDQNLRRTYYGVTGIPAGFGNGVSAGGSATSWRSSGLSNIAQQTPVSITLNGGINGYDLQVNVIVTSETNLSGSDLRLFLFTSMDSAWFNAPNGVTDHQFMFVDFLTPNTGQSITLDGVNDYTQSYTWTMPGNWPNGNTGVLWDISNLNVGAFVQNYTTKAVLQAEGARANSMNNDVDADGVFNWEDNCPDTFNPGQEDVDGDLMGDACDPCDNTVFVLGNVSGDDIDGHPVIDIFDVLMLVDMILGDNLGDCPGEAANFNADATINVLDVMQLVQYILSGQPGNLSEGDAGVGALQILREPGRTRLALSGDGEIGGIQFSIPQPESRLDLDLSGIPEGWEFRYGYQTGRTIIMLFDPSGRNPRYTLELVLPGDDLVEISDLVVSDIRGAAIHTRIVTEKSTLDGEIPSEMVVVRMYPNPFNPEIHIVYQLSQETSVRILVYDVHGREVDVIAEQQLKQPGRYQLDWDASGYPSGLYFIRIQTPVRTDTQKALLLK